MTDTIEKLRADLASAGLDPDQVQLASGSGSSHEGTYVCGREAVGYVVTQLGRGEMDDRRELFDSADEAVAFLRGRLLGTPSRTLSPQESEEIRVRMQRRSDEIKASLRHGRVDE